MRCMYYQDGPGGWCCAFLGGLKLPTQEEKERFCLNGAMCKRCPTFIKKEKDIQKIG